MVLYDFKVFIDFFLKEIRIRDLLKFNDSKINQKGLH